MSELVPRPTTYTQFGRSLEDLMPPPIADAQLERIKIFLDTEWGLPAVVSQLRTLFAGGLPPIPSPVRWHVASHIDIAQLVWEQVQNEKFVDEWWPSVKMLLGEDTCNSKWAAETLTVLAIFNLIRILPICGGD